MVDHPRVTQDTQAIFIPSNKGQYPLVQDPFHYLYSYNKKSANTTYYSCTKKKQGCKATAKLVDDVIKCTSGHNHCCDMVAVKIKKTKADVKALVIAQPSSSTAKAVTDWTTQVSEPALITAAPQLLSMTVQVNRWKRKALGKPMIPVDIDDEALDTANIPINFRQTRDGGPYLRYNGAEEGSRRFIIYMSDEGIKFLKRAEIWSMDGTYKTCPKPFSQLYTIVASVNGQGYPAAFVFMPDKKKVTYSCMFQQLREILEKEEPMVTYPDRIILDFEVAVPRALKYVFPEIKHISLCHVHLCRSILKNLGAHHILTWFYKSPTFHTFVKSLAALAFLPAAEIPDRYFEMVGKNTQRLYDSQREIVEEEFASQPAKKAKTTAYLDDTDALEEDCERFRRGLDGFLDYFEATYVGRKNRAGTFTRPTFEPELWSQYDAAMNKMPTDSNLNESLHGVMSKTINENSSIWTVVTTLQDIEVRTNKRHSDYISNFAATFVDGEGEPKEGVNARKKTTLKRRSMLQNEVECYKMHSNGEYLSRIVNFFQMDKKSQD